MMFCRRINLVLALTGACASAAIADTFSFEGPQYVPGSPIAGITDPNGSTWEMEGSETGDLVVDAAVFSPLANPLIGGVSTKSLRHDLSLAQSRLGLDLAAPVTTGIVTLQYDVRNTTRTTGNGLLRLNILNRAGVTNASPAGTVDIQYQPYIQNGGGGAAAQNGFFGLADNPAAIGACSIMDQSPYQPGQPFNPHDLKEATGANDYWYRIKMWFNMDDAVNPGRLLYIGMYDINCGMEILVGEHHVSRQLVAVRKNNDPLAPNAIRAFQLRGTGTADNSMWIDNLVIAADPGFVLPTPTGDVPIVPSSVFNADAGSQEVTTAFTLPTNAGETVSMARSGATIYASDSNNGLVSWSGGPAAAAVDDMLEVDFDSDGTGVLVADTAGTLYAVASLAGSGVWRELLRYDSGSGTWVTVVDGDTTGGNTGNHSAALLTFGGTNHVFHAWTGAAFYPSLNTDGTRGPDLTGVGNRWAGACTEGHADGSTGSLLYYLQQTDAAGTPISNNSQAYNAIYGRSAWTGIGCDQRVFLPGARVSASGRLLPWVTNVPDGGNVNRHSMEFEPARNRIWVLRAGNSNEIGIYDIAQDRFGLLRVNRPGGAALTMDKADLQLSADGSQMYILARGEGAVYAVDTNITFANTGACISGASCTVLSAAACATVSGTYLGDNQVCPPSGACCNGTTCTISYQVTCTAGGGSFQGAGTVCEDYDVGTGGAFEDISATGTDIATGDDDSTSIPIGFGFTHYGNTYTNVRAGANGYLSFSGGDGPESWVPRLGDSMEPNDVIAGLWTDLSPQCTTGGLKYEIRGSAPSRRLIVQWTNVSQYTGDCTPIDANTFQIVLFEGTNISEVRLGDLNNPSSTPLPAYQTGIENGNGVQSEIVATASIVDNAAFQFTATPNPCAPQTGACCCGSNCSVTTAAACSGANQAFSGAGTVCTPFSFTVPCCRGNYNKSAPGPGAPGGVSVQDIFDFLAGYFANDACANANDSVGPNNGVSVQDIFDFLAAYFGGC